MLVVSANFPKKLLIFTIFFLIFALLLNGFFSFAFSGIDYVAMHDTPDPDFSQGEPNGDWMTSDELKINDPEIASSLQQKSKINNKN